MRKRDTTSSRCVRNERYSRRFSGRKCRRRPRGGRAGGRSGTYWAMGDVGRQCWTFSPLRMCEGWCHRWKRVTPGVRCQSGSSESGWSGKRNRRRRRRGWVPRGNWVQGRSHRCSCPCLRSWYRQRRSEKESRFFPFIFPSVTVSFVFSLVRITSSWDRPGWRAKRGACNEPPLRGLRTGKPGKRYAAMI